MFFKRQSKRTRYCFNMISRSSTISFIYLTSHRSFLLIGHSTSFSHVCQHGESSSTLLYIGFIFKIPFPIQIRRNKIFQRFISESTTQFIIIHAISHLHIKRYRLTAIYLIRAKTIKMDIYFEF